MSEFLEHVGKPDPSTAASVESAVALNPLRDDTTHRILVPIAETFGEGVSKREALQNAARIINGHISLHRGRLLRLEAGLRQVEEELARG